MSDLHYNSFKEFSKEFDELDSRNLLIDYHLDDRALFWKLNIIQSRKLRTLTVSVGVTIPASGSDLTTIQALCSSGLQDLRNDLRRCKKTALTDWHNKDD